VKKENPMSYDLKPWKAPKAAGVGIRMLTAMVGHPPLGGALSSLLLKNLGIPAFRRVEASGTIPFGPPARPSLPAAGHDSGPLVQQAAGAESRAGSGFAFESAGDYAHAYLQGRTDPEEVARRLLKFTKDSDEMKPPLRVFIAQKAEDVLRQAQESAGRYRQKKPLSPLDGVPVAVKDELDQRGYPTSVGTSFLGRELVSEDAEVVSRLRRAGALLLGKANMHEIGILPTGLNPIFGAARNPYDPARETGGSSSGPAAAVAAGLCPIAVGADGGGSVRIPASFCGVFGLKPTFGRMSEHGAAPLCWSVAHVGPVGATLRDVALAYAVMAGPDPKDKNSLDQPAPVLTGFGRRDLSGIRLGICTPWFEDADAEVVAACRKVLEGLKAAGCAVEEVELPDLSLLRTVHTVIIVSEMAAAHLQHFRNHRREYSTVTRLNLSLARRLKATDYVHAQRHRMRLCEQFDSVMRKVDALVTPSTGCTAPVIAEKALKTDESNLTLIDRIMRYARPANLTGYPAISFPAGYDSQGLPIGFQVMGRSFEEHKLLQIAAAAEGLVEREKPRVHYRVLPGGAAG
jgi:Asp-tRNA(Asn)/Glu-tRNA(Gln) amidotransferase A subunit family amidase